MKNYLVFVLIVFVLSKQNGQHKVPFLEPDTVHQTKSQFQLNLIFNENRNLPIIFAQFSKQFMKDYIYNIVNGAIRKQPEIVLALFVDCRNFVFDLNKTLGICNGFNQQKAKQEEEREKDLQDSKKQDNFFRFDFMSPNPSKIRQKGHLLAKNHDVQNLRQTNYQLTQDFLAKVIKNQIPDFITYIEDNYDMSQFLETKNQFSFSKKAKIFYFDQNLQSPLFLKKLAARLDGAIKVGVTDNYKLTKKFDAFYDSVLLMQYNFQTQNYEHKKISFNEGSQIMDILENQQIKRYLSLKKYRDIILDFEHRDVTIYNMSTLTEINHLMTFGRLIYLQISSQQETFQCKALNKIAQKYKIFFNYVCFSRKNINFLQKSLLKIEDSNRFVFIINKSLKDTKKILYSEQNFNAYDYLPGIPARQKVSASSEAQICLKTAFASKRDPVFYWYNQKQHRNTLKLLQYFNSLPEVTSLIYFCQIYLPDKDLIKDYKLQENSLFSMKNMNNQGEMQKFEFRQALQFTTIKMFLRQLAIGQMTKFYEEKLSQNSVKQITSAEQLTRECFNKDCIIGLIATNKFRYESELEILKQIKLEIHEQGYNIFWIDGYCHWDVAKQLKLLTKKQKVIDRSFIFYYKEKNNSLALMNVTNKYWVKKDVKKWIKSLIQPGVIKNMKFGIDIQDKKCQKKQIIKKENNVKRKQNSIHQNEL